jgi:predicted RNase H-like nuclease (RuvC/YqgF family)
LGTVTVTTQKSKLEMLTEQETRLSGEVEAARARIAEYPALLHDARSRAVYSKPNIRPGAELNGEVAKLTAKEKKDVASLQSLEQDLSAIRSVLAIEAQRVSEEATAKASRQLAELHEQEEAVSVV